MSRFLQKILAIFLWWQPKTITSRTSIGPSAIDPEEHGRWRLRRDILEKLDYYHDCAKALKKADRDSYNLYSQIGAQISGPKQLASKAPSSKWTQGDRLGFGALMLVHDAYRESKDRVAMRFIGFRRLSKPPRRVENADGDIYQITAIFDASAKKGVVGGKRRIRGVFEYHMALSPRCEVSLLKELITTNERIKGKNRDRWATRSAWDYPRSIKMLYEDRKLPEDETIEEYAANMFWLAATPYEDVLSGVRVQAAKGGVVAAFSIDLLRTPYFFKDREWVANEKGSRKRIFHIVRTHERKAKDGVRYVKSHFRGSRNFKWNGYDITITMPGKHHPDLLQWDVAATQFEDTKAVPKGWMGSKELGAALSGVITEKPFIHATKGWRGPGTRQASTNGRRKCQEASPNG